jgi:phage virion morphogenesis protein
MSGDSISISVNDAEVRAAFASLRSHLANLTPVMRSIGQGLRTNVDLCFRGEHDPWGVPWQHLAASTLRRRRGTSAQILQDTRRLANSMTYRADSNSVSVGTNVEYAAIHQFGGDIQHAARTSTLYFRQRRDGSVGNRFVRRNRSNFAQDVTIGAHTTHIPARPFLPIRNGRADLPPAWQADMLAILARYLTA